MAFQIYRVLHLLVTGTIVILISTFMASGGLGENFTGNPYPYPIFFIPLIIWTIGAVLSFVPKLVKLGLTISALPFLYYVITILFAYFK